MSTKHYVSSLPPPYLISPQVGFCNIYKPTTIDNITIQQKLIKFYYGQIITTPFFSQILFNNLTSVIINILKTVIPFHVYKILIVDTNLFIDKIQFIIYLIYFLQENINKKKSSHIFDNLNKHFLFIFKNYLNYCSSINIDYIEAPEKFRNTIVKINTTLASESVEALKHFRKYLSNGKLGINFIKFANEINNDSAKLDNAAAAYIQSIQINNTDFVSAFINAANIINISLIPSTPAAKAAAEAAYQQQQQQLLHQQQQRQLRKYMPNKDAISLMDTLSSIQGPFNEKLKELHGKLTDLVSNKPSGSLLKNLMDYVTQVNINVFDMAQKEKDLKSNVKLPSYITLPSTWFLEDTKAISDKRLAPTKGTAEMDKIIDKYKNLVSDSFETSSTTVQNNIDKTIDILFKVNDLYINDVQDFTIIKIKHSAGMGQQGSTEEIRSGEVGDDERDLVINFITDSISISDKIREEFVVKLIDKLKRSSDFKEVARVCNNINKYGENRFMLSGTQRSSINKFCYNVKFQNNQSKKQTGKQNPKPKPFFSLSGIRGSQRTQQQQQQQSGQQSS